MTIDNKEQAIKARQDKRFINKQSQTAAKYLRRLEELSGAPEGMNAFYEALNRIYVEMGHIETEPGQKTVGTYCVMTPPELIYAAKALPVKLCSGNYTAFSVGDSVAPRDACPLVKAAAGFKQTGLMPLYEDCSMMIVPITCDCKKKIAGMLSDKCEVMTLHIPALRNDEDIDEFKEELYVLIEKLEQITGNTITYESLSDAFNKVGYAQYELSRFIGLKKKTPYLIRGSHAMAILNASAYMPADKWADALHNINGNLKRRISEHENHWLEKPL